MKILVTGATGFVGSWVVRKLLDAGHSVRILRRESSDLALLNHLPLEHAIGDINNINSIEQAVTGTEGIFHLAGVVGYSRKDRILMEKVNVEGTANITKICRQFPSLRFLHMSSVVAVGASFNGIPLDENSPYNVSHLNLGYFETKRKAEEIVLHEVKEHGLNAVIVNPSTIYGPGDATKGSRKTQLKVARGKMPFFTNGGVSIVHIEDCVAAMLTAFNKGKKGERYILSGDNISIERLFQLIAEEAGVAAPKVRLPNWLVHSLGYIGDHLEAIGKKGPLNSESAWTAVLYHWFDHSKAKAELNFEPRPAEDAIQASVRWIKEQNLL